MENIQERGDCIVAEGLEKKFKNFCLEIPRLRIPRGFATALIGENGAGKTTLLNLLSGIRLDYKGTISYFGNAASPLSIEESDADGVPIKEKIGYVGDHQYYLPQWKVGQIRKLMGLLFDGFHPEQFDALMEEFHMDTGKKVKDLSDGNRMKLMLAGAFSRDTELLLLDEPSSALDPLMRETLNDMLRDYLANGEGKNSIFFSTHNISDMESVTDYAIIMEQGRIVEEGFVEVLREKYLLVKGERETLPLVQSHLFSKTESAYGFEGMILASKKEQLSAAQLTFETPNLFQISVAVMRHFASEQKGEEEK